MQALATLEEKIDKMVDARVREVMQSTRAQFTELGDTIPGVMD